MKSQKRQKIILFLQLVTSIYWVIGQEVDVYASMLQVFYELLWLPMIGMVFVLPILAAWFWIKSKFHLGSAYFYSLLIGMATITYLFLK